MILLLGGTSDTLPIAERLARSGCRVLVSRATPTPLDVGDHKSIESRSGPLDDHGMADLIRQRGIRAIVDATHPYATAIRARASRVAEALNCPYLTFIRPPAIDPNTPGVDFAQDHDAASVMAFAHSRPVLVTTGSNHLAPYVAEARRRAVPLVVRVLGNRQSLDACSRAGLQPSEVLTGRGPFSLDENRRQIRNHGIGVLVTKDSGQAGGTLEKLEAARLEGCRIVVVQRPDPPVGRHCADIDSLLAAVAELRLSTDSGHR